MSKHLFSAILLAFSISGYAQNVQTGIGTASPAQTLHVAGASSPAGGTAVGSTGVNLVTPTVRVEGLNSTNNTAHNASDGTNSLKRVYANQSGDLVLVNSNLEQQAIAQDIGDAIPAVEKIGTVGSGYESIELKSLNFTLIHPSVVYFSATLSASLNETALLVSAPITDGRAKLFGAYFQFSSAPDVTFTTAAFGNNKKTYENGNALALTAVKDFTLNPRAKLVLPAGVYTVKLYGQLFSSSAGNPFRVTFGGGTTGENFLINATPIQYQ